MNAMLRAGAVPVLCGGVLLGGCVVNAINGSGTMKTEARPVSGFSRVALSGGGRLVLDRAGSESVSVTADDNLLPYIKTEVHGDTLDLGFDDSMNGYRPTKDVVFTVSAKQLEELAVSGSGVADVKGLEGNVFRATISGSGDVIAKGHAGDLDVVVSGSGGYRGDGMASEHARVHVSGSGDVLVAAADTLDASVSGSGTIEYVGSPRVSDHISGSGTVRRAAR
jgi:hypothetical protein